MGARRRCCCAAGCWYFQDNFGDGTARNNTSDLGADWNEVVGQWGILGWTLVENYATGGGTAGALLITTQAQPAATAGLQYLHIDIFDPQTGDIYYLYPCCPSTSAVGPLEITFECTSAPGNWTVTIGDEFVDVEILPDEHGWYQALCCVDHEAGMAKAWMNYGINATAWNDAADPGDGRYSGLGHDNAVASPNIGAQLDVYFVGELRTAAGAVCYDCFCRCKGFAPPRELTATITNASGRYACADGFSTTIQWDELPSREYWHGVIEDIKGSIEEGYNNVPVDIDLILRCGSESPSDPEGYHFTLSIDIDADCCATNVDLCAHAHPVTDTEYTHCDNFTLTFGPYRAVRSDLNCFLCYDPDPWGYGGTPDAGEFYITITL